MSVRNDYLDAGDVLLSESGCTVRSWRAGRNGTAFTSADDWGIEVPRPVGPVSFGVFAHEVGHQLLHRSGSRPRWLEEVQADEWALAQFDRFGLAGRERYLARATDHIGYAFAKALRRSSPSTRPALARRIRNRCPEWWRLTARQRQTSYGSIVNPELSPDRAALDVPVVYPASRPSRPAAGSPPPRR